MGFASASAGSPPPKSPACFFEMNDQVTASTSPLAASARLAARVRLCRIGEHRTPGVGAALERRRRHALKAENADDFLDEVGLALDVAAPAGCRDLHCIARARDDEAERGQDALDLAYLGLKPREPARLGERKIDHAPAIGNGTREHDLRRLAAAKLNHELGGKLQPRHGESGIDAALEAETRVGRDAELAPGLRDIGRIPQSGFDQDVGRRFRAAARFAAHDAGKRFDAPLVGDHAHIAAELVGAAVEGEQFLSILRAPYHEAALDLGRVEHVQGPRAVEGDEVGDVDERVDGPEPDRAESPLQPFGRGAVLHAAHEPKRESRAKRRLFDFHRHRAEENSPLIGLIAESFSLPSWAAARSRAMP